MESIRELYRIGIGPSSSHTMAPRRAAEIFLGRQPSAARYQVTLFASLAATGRGHLTDKALEDAFAPQAVRVVWKPDEPLPLHPNGMRFEAFADDQSLLETWEVYSVGGGTLRDSRDANLDSAGDSIYSLRCLEELITRSAETGETCWEYVLASEDEEILAYLDQA